MEAPDKFQEWKKISDLGTGAFGTVMLWRNELTNECFAIKKCKFNIPSAISSKQRKRWEQEVDFLKTIDHNNVIKYKKLPSEFEKFLNRSNPSKLSILPMEYCKKGNLRKFLFNEPINLCGLPEDDIKYIMKDVCNGLKYLHSKNITHRDLKPDNIVLRHCESRKSQNEYVIIDLGYAKELQGGTLSFVGTLQYLAPEIFQSENYTKSVDYWSMGLILFELCCGVLPFLPELSPFERFEKIANKGCDDICISQSYSGAISTSKYIKEENFLNNWLKENTELWLRNVLQIDSSERTTMNQIDAFDYLIKILDKPTIKVFSVQDFNFYSYTIDSVMAHSLPDLLSKDTELPADNLLVLYSDTNCDKDYCSINSCDDIQTLVKLENVEVFCFNKGSKLQDRNYDLPNLLRELFKVANPFDMKYARPLYRQALFFIYKENTILQYLKKSFFVLLSYIEKKLSALQDKQTEALHLFNNLLDKIQKRNKIHSENRVQASGNAVLVDCLKHYERLLSNLERRDENLKKFNVQIKISRSHAEEFKRKVIETFEKNATNNMFQTINNRSFLQKEQGDSKPILNRISNIINATIKEKVNFFSKKDEVHVCLENIWNLLNLLERLRSWVNDFIGSLEELTVNLTLMEESYEKLVSQNHKRNVISGGSLSFIQLDANKIIKENEQLRNDLDKAFAQLTLTEEE